MMDSQCILLRNPSAGVRESQGRWLSEEPTLVEYLRLLGMREYEQVYSAVIVGYPATDGGLPNQNMMPQKGNEVAYIDRGEWI